MDKNSELVVIKILLCNKRRFYFTYGDTHPIFNLIITENLIKKYNGYIYE